MKKITNNKPCSMVIVSLFSLTLVSLVACGESSSTSIPPTGEVPLTESTEAVTCTEPQVLPTSLFNEEADHYENFDASKAIDGQLTANSRWHPISENANLTLQFSTPITLTGIKIAWHANESKTHRARLLASTDANEFTAIDEDIVSYGSSSLPEFYPVSDTLLSYLKVMINLTEPTDSAIREILVYGCRADGEPPQRSDSFDPRSLGLDPLQPPSNNFDLLSWSLTTPADLDANGRADIVYENTLSNGFENQYFYTGPNGGMVFQSTISGVTSSPNTKYTRSELREMLRRGDTSIPTRGVTANNWLLGYQPETSAAVGGRNGHLKVTLAINRVTTTGEDYQTGRVIIGQIHAKDDEPIRLYYRKLPTHERGILYFAHEIRGGDDLYRVLLGPQISDGSHQPQVESDPAYGIRLDEPFSYEIIQQDARIDVLLRSGDWNAPIIAHQHVDMREQNSGYNVDGEWVYFKAGAYSQNNSGDPNEFDQVTIYQLSHSHE